MLNEKYSEIHLAITVTTPTHNILLLATLVKFTIMLQSTIIVGLIAAMASALPQVTFGYVTLHFVLFTKSAVAIS
jgi:hypothetical protein